MPEWFVSRISRGCGGGHGNKSQVGEEEMRKKEMERRERSQRRID